MKDVISIMITQEKKKVPLFTNLIERIELHIEYLCGVCALSCDHRLLARFSLSFSLQLKRGQIARDCFFFVIQFYPQEMAVLQVYIKNYRSNEFYFIFFGIKKK